jgi:ParB family transcriptional regulator, chromosome partitioning protein
VVKSNTAKKQAFDAQRGSYFMIDPDDLVIIGLDTPHKRGDHPLYDDRIHCALPEGMVESIISLGVIQVIEIRKEQWTEKGIVANGRFRTRAAREANRLLMARGLPTVMVKCVQVKGEDDWMVATMIATNEFRTDDSPLLRAQKILKFLSYGRTKEEAAKMFGFKSAQSVTDALKLLDLHQDVKQAVNRGELAASAAVKLHDLPVESQAELVASGDVTAKAVAARVKAVKRGTRESTTKFAPMTRSVMRDLVKANAEGRAPDLLPDTINAFRLALGEIGPNSVTGAEGGFAAIGKEF